MSPRQFLKKILVPVDGSSPSLMAQRTAANIAKKTGASVTAFHMLQELNLGYTLPTTLRDELIDSVEQHANQIETNALALFKREKVEADVSRLKGADAADAILKLSEKNYDLIVMGASGEDILDPNLLGSVTKKVMRHTKLPTLITKNTRLLSKILVCTDGSKNAVLALNYAAELSKQAGSKLTLLSVVEKKIRDLSPETAKKAGEQIIQNTVKAAGKKERKLDELVKFGPAANTITEVAKEGNYDLIVMGSRGSGAVSRFLIGSVSDNVCHKAECSVLIVPTGT
jgi:nucleotide-binding universal stress UspA family protein